MSVTVSTLFAVLLSGACMSQQSDDVNEPLPRKSRESSLAWAREYTSAMARYAEVRITDHPASRKHFEECVGKNNEVADDGRYMLTYTAYAKIPDERHIGAVRKLRKALEEHGVRVTSHTERPETPEVILYGTNDEQRFSLIADSVNPPGTLRLSVSTACFLPPGVKQQQF
ncbi:hypothetical protein RCO28_00250 [Streptomyces sp. LHD-70]|uniref:hypothetical protein n=1 Tax=Streptomyces sp. LHD-70 TaxID=3072140 RepID=UPI00280E0011|nr:hypothetical protein [Streptomyces sp. LHD-70]MDQ8700924.1 hypothetical protein [Streptomyces sp. LHD-70]